jgi:hypothetical protein
MLRPLYLGVTRAHLRSRCSVFNCVHSYKHHDANVTTLSTREDLKKMLLT